MPFRRGCGETVEEETLVPLVATVAITELPPAEPPRARIIERTGSVTPTSTGS
ncbi:hypothetical protein ACFZCU_43970 [Streptomyces canus]|uniref:hypothetical protein n=1 Tax=Streptomyces canus TaxID=58343 RepID=UPI0036ED5A13